MKKNFVYGIRAIIEAINSGQTIEKILLKNNLKGQLFSELYGLAKQRKIPFQFVPVEKINRFTTKNHQGAIAFLSLIEYADIEAITQNIFDKGKLPFFVILDGVTDVRNFGAIARTAECAGVDAIIIKTKGSAQINNDAIKTSAGALYKIPVARVENLVKTVKFLKNSGIIVVAASEKGSVYHFEHDFTLPVAIIMGAEDRGPSTEMLKIADKVIKIPMIGTIESLNVANAASVIIYEVVRQRIIERNQ
jgi:23S rRNA (guanosine2251-2'-O)-methyltransferase